MRKTVTTLGLVVSLPIILYILSSSRETDTISLHIGKHYEDIIRDSTFPVRSETVIRPTLPPEEDSTWFTDPVIIEFDDSEHGFILPPTRFGAVGYYDGRVTTITTSPMLETLTFDQLIPLVKHLQEMLKKSRWMPENVHNYTWLKLDNDIEKNALQQLLFNHIALVMLRVPEKYSLALNVKCYIRCEERNPKTARYLIDISVGRDFRTPQEPQ